MPKRKKSLGVITRREPVSREKVLKGIEKALLEIEKAFNDLKKVLSSHYRTRRWREPFVSTSEDIIHRMLRVARVRPDELVYDLGCGDGRIPIIAAKHFQAYGVGVEIQKSLVQKARDRASELRVSDRVNIIHGSFNKVDLRDADVLALYLTSSTLAKLEKKFRKELRPGTRITTHTYSIYGWTPSKEVNFKSRVDNSKIKIYLYVRS